MLIQLGITHHLSDAQMFILAVAAELGLTENQIRMILELSEEYKLTDAQMMSNTQLN